MTIDDLIRHMDPEAPILAVRGRNEEQVLQEITQALVERGHVRDADVVLQMLRNREALGSTAVGPGVAFPHGRSLSVQRLTVLVARSADGVDFNSLDHEPTHLFFILLAPPQDSGNLYLQALGKLVELAGHDDTLKAMMDAQTMEDLIGILKGAGK